MSKTTDVIVYIDGFNLEYGLMEKYGRRYHWLDLERLSQLLLLPSQRLLEVKYFTAPARRSPEILRRQQAYWNALESHTSRLTIIPGHFQERTLTCRECGSSRKAFEEKETDVAIAVALVEDAAVRASGAALLVSADTDLCPAIEAIRRLHPTEKVVAGFPPARNAEKLRRITDASFTITRRKLAASKLPEKVITPDGKIFSRPPSWK